MKKIIIKHRLKNLAIEISYLIVIFLIAFLYDKVFEIFGFILSYSLIRNEFSKMVHGSDFTKSAHKGIVYCRIITFIVQVVSIIFIIKLNISKYVNVGLAMSLGVVNFFAKDYIEYKYVKYCNIRNIDKDTLVKKCREANLSEDAINRMVLKFIEHKSNQEIADLECVEAETIKKSISRSRKRINL
nr:MAG TPA: ECF sigma factor [Caudoviricetes sp.]